MGADSDPLELEKRTGQLVAGDRLLLCSDGLCKTLPEEQLLELLSGDSDTGAERLVAAALTAKVNDNVTAITISFGTDQAAAIDVTTVNASIPTMPKDA